MNKTILGMALTPLLATGAVLAQAPTSEFEVRALLDAEGFNRVDDVDYEQDRGLWEAEVVTADGEEVEVHIDPLTGRILVGDGEPYVRGMVLPPPPRTVVLPVPVEYRTAVLDEGSVRSILLSAGFNSVHDVDFDDGVWKAEARDASGDDLEIHVDTSGRIAHVEDD